MLADTELLEATSLYWGTLSWCNAAVGTKLSLCFTQRWLPFNGE